MTTMPGMAGERRSFRCMFFCGSIEPWMDQLMCPVLQLFCYLSWASFKGNLECSCVSLESENNSDLGLSENVGLIFPMK